MKKLKCPLCGGSFELFDEGISTYLYQCLDCPLASEVSCTEDGALENAEELVSKFPPIMRVQKGDKIIYFNNMYHRQGGVVMGVDFTTMRILLEDGSTPSEMVVKWPWELEQKGGNND